MEGAGNFCQREHIPRKLKTETQAEYVGIDPDVAAFDAGIGQVPKAVIEIQGGSVGKEIFDPYATLQNKFERIGYLFISHKKVTPGTPPPDKHKRSPVSFGIEKLIFQLRGHQAKHESRRLIHDLTIPFRVDCCNYRTCLNHPIQSPPVDGFSHEPGQVVFEVGEKVNGPDLGPLAGNSRLRGKVDGNPVSQIETKFILVLGEAGFEIRK